MKLEDTREQDKISGELEALKKKEGEEVQVDANFGKPQANADQFREVTVKIGKKRTQPPP